MKLQTPDETPEISRRRDDSDYNDQNGGGAGAGGKVGGLSAERKSDMALQA